MMMGQPFREGNHDNQRHSVVPFMSNGASQLHRPTTKQVTFRTEGRPANRYGPRSDMEYV